MVILNNTEALKLNKRTDRSNRQRKSRLQGYQSQEEKLFWKRIIDYDYIQYPQATNKQMMWCECQQQLPGPCLGSLRPNRNTISKRPFPSHNQISMWYLLFLDGSLPLLLSLYDHCYLALFPLLFLTSSSPSVFSFLPTLSTSSRQCLTHVPWHVYHPYVLYQRNNHSTKKHFSRLKLCLTQSGP